MAELEEIQFEVGSLLYQLDAEGLENTAIKLGLTEGALKGKSKFMVMKVINLYIEKEVLTQDDGGLAIFLSLKEYIFLIYLLRNK